MKEKISISQGLSWMKTLKDRHQELVGLRNINSAVKTQRWGETKEDVITNPVYDVKKLDKMINKVALEIRKLDDGIKATNTMYDIVNYEKDEDVLGELE